MFSASPGLLLITTWEILFRGGRKGFIQLSFKILTRMTIEAPQTATQNFYRAVAKWGN